MSVIGVSIMVMAVGDMSSPATTHVYEAEGGIPRQRVYASLTANTGDYIASACRERRTFFHAPDLQRQRHDSRLDVSTLGVRSEPDGGEGDASVADRVRGEPRMSQRGP
jgi:hypothetical protein